MVGGYLWQVHGETFTLENLEKIIQQAGYLAPLIFIVFYAAGTLFFFPGLPLTITGGLLFGPTWGTFYNMVGALIGSSLAFLTTRYLMQDFVLSQFKKDLDKLLNETSAQGFKFVAIVRLIPVIPFNAINYVLGLTKVSYINFLFASAIFMLPACAVYTYIGSLGKDALNGDFAVLAKKVLLGVSGIIVLVLVTSFVKKYKNEFEG